MHRSGTHVVVPPALVWASTFSIPPPHLPPRLAHPRLPHPRLLVSPLLASSSPPSLSALLVSLLLVLGPTHCHRPVLIQGHDTLLPSLCARCCLAMWVRVWVSAWVRGLVFRYDTSASFNCPYLLIHTSRSFYSSRPFHALAFFCFICNGLRSTSVKCHFSFPMS